MAYAFSIGYGQKAVSEGAWAFSPAPVSEMATKYVGSWFATILELVVILDAMALALAICVMIGRGFFALGRDGLLPKVFAKTSRHDTPWVGNLMVAFGGIGLVVIALSTNYASQFGFLDEAGKVRAVLPERPVRVVHRLGHRRLVRDRARLPRSSLWSRSASSRRAATSRGSTLIVAVAVVMPILGFYGALHPAPHDSSNYNWVATVLDAWTDRRRARLVRDRARDPPHERGQRRLARCRAPGRRPARRDAGVRARPVSETAAWHRIGPAEELPDGTLRRVEVAGRAVCLGRVEGGWVAFDDTCTHEECPLSDGDLDGAIVVCPCHGSEFDIRTGDVLSPPALDPLPIFDVRVERGELEVRLEPTAAAASRDAQRDEHVPAAPGAPPTVAEPSDRRSRARRRRPLRSRRLGGRRAARLVRAPAPPGAAALAGRGERPRLLVVHPLRRHRQRLEGLRDVLVGDRRHLARGSDAVPGRGPQVDARHRPAAAHPHARARQQGLHAQGRQRVRGAYPRARARHPRAAFEKDGVRLGRGRRRRAADVGLLRDHGPAARGPEAADRARRQAARQHRPRGRRRGAHVRQRRPHRLQGAPVLEPVSRAT